MLVRLVQADACNLGLECDLMVIFGLLIVDGLLIDCEAGGHPLHVGVKVWFTLPLEPVRVG